MSNRYTCLFPSCNASYSTKYNLKRHIKVNHLGIKLFQCASCPKSFATKQNLTEHSYIHTGDKPFPCPYCNKCFRQASQVLVHKKKHCSMRYSVSGKAVILPDDVNDIMLTELLGKFQPVYQPIQHFRDEAEEPGLVKLPRIGNEQPLGPLPNAFA